MIATIDEWRPLLIGPGLALDLRCYVAAADRAPRRARRLLGPLRRPPRPTRGRKLSLRLHARGSLEALGMAQAEALGRSRLGATIRGVMPTAAEVLERTKNAYATCSSYRDRGEVVTVFITGVKPYHRRTTRRPFRTAFLRPDSFYFQFRDVTVGPESEWSMYAVWAAGGRARSWSTRDERIKAHPSILEALSGPTGVSGGSAIRIPRLLIPNEHQAYSLPAPDGSTMREDATRRPGRAS